MGQNKCYHIDANGDPCFCADKEIHYNGVVNRIGSLVFLIADEIDSLAQFGLSDNATPLKQAIRRFYEVATFYRRGRGDTSDAIRLSERAAEATVEACGRPIPFARPAEPPWENSYQSSS